MLYVRSTNIEPWCGCKPRLLENGKYSFKFFLSRPRQQGTLSPCECERLKAWHLQNQEISLLSDLNSIYSYSWDPYIPAPGTSFQKVSCSPCPFSHQPAQDISFQMALFPSFSPSNLFQRFRICIVATSSFTSTPRKYAQHKNFMNGITKIVRFRKNAPQKWTLDPEGLIV